MKALLSFILLTVIFAICSCQTKVKKIVNIKSDSIQKPKPINRISKAEADSDKYVDSAMTAVEKLPEIRNLRIWFYNMKPDTSHHFALNVPEGPRKDLNYYWVRVGEDTPDHFGTYENFYVDAKSFTVYYGVEQDSMLTIKQWRKSGKDKWYKKR